MKVLTENPVYVDQTKISNPSKYLSFDGSNTQEVQAFQDWMDMTRPGWYRGGNLNKGKNYGKMDRPTKKANRSFGNDFDSLVASRGGTRAYLGKINPVTGEFTPPTDQYSTTSPTGQTKKGAFWDKARGGWVKARDVVDRTQGFMNRLDTVFGAFGRGADITQDQGWNQNQTMDFDQDRGGMSRGAKIGLIIGGIVMATVVTVLIVRHAKKGKAKGK